jgi:hypothetical protein
MRLPVPCALLALALVAPGAGASAIPTKALGPAPDRGPREPAEVVDVLLAELYDLGSQARSGSYPNGRNGLSATTTSCNHGNVEVPWFAPMSPNHPFIGLAMFRESGGALEMIGKSWIKHGFFAATDNQCALGCQEPSGPQRLGVGCSDTYSVTNNASMFYLGPREEVNPHTGAWQPCGSFFDGTPADCQRSYFGGGTDVSHLLEVHDADLGDSQASYFYEACYFVAGDDSVHNNIGWRACTTSWSGSSWTIRTTGGPFETTPQPGPVVLRWGDQHDVEEVAPGDGLAILATEVTDLGAGQWHYEYALYNRSSDRGIRSFSIPFGAANVTNAGFRDADRDPATDWTVEIAEGAITWSTDEWATDPDAPALFYQTLVNFRFDADQPPAPASATAGLFKPGPHASVFFDTQAPTAGAVVVAAGGARLDAIGPNPFSATTELRFDLPRRLDVRLSVVDVTGRTVSVIVEGLAPAGPTRIRWNGRDAGGRRVANGVYFFRLESVAGTRVAKVTLLR